MNQKLSGKLVAILATDGFEQSELLEPKKALEDAGAKTALVSLQSGTIQGWKDSNWGTKIQVDKIVPQAKASDFDALLLPGGVMNPDKLRDNSDAVSFVREFVDTGKPIGAICHGPWILINAEAVKGIKLTSYSSIKIDLINAGANWVDESVVVDSGIVTSRKPSDIPDFCKKLIEEITEGKHSRT